jgi:ribonuclease HI
MELQAVIEALKLLKEECSIEIYSDSAYVVNAFDKGWINNWIKNGWKTSGKDPVKNKELWQELYELTKIHDVKFVKVKGHSDNEFNNRCDELARNAINQ